MKRCFAVLFRMNVSNPLDVIPVQTYVCPAPGGPSGGAAVIAAGEQTAATSVQPRSGWLEGIFGCFRPVFWNIANKSHKGGGGGSHSTST